MADHSEWIVTTSGARPLGDVARDLGRHGFRVRQTLDEIGCFVGDASADVVDALRTVDGVIDVSQPGREGIGPPDAPVTW